MSLIVFLILCLTIGAINTARADYTNDTSQAYGGSGINFLLDGSLQETAFDCDPTEKSDCYALNLEACHSSAVEISLSANFVSTTIGCDNSSQRKIWLSSDASCQDTTATEYITTPRTLNESDTASNIYLLCNNSVDYYPNSNLSEEAFTSTTLFTQAGETSACSSGVDQIIYLCYAIGPVAGGSSGSNSVFGWHKFKIDTKAPATPTVTVEEGDQKVVVNYSGSDSDIKKTIVYYREAQDGDSDNCRDWSNSAEYVGEKNKGSITISGLKNGQDYQYCVVMLDDLGNASEPTPVTTFSAVDECDFWECAPEELGKGGFCFIATAAYGPGDPVLEILRRFRDTVLMESNPGRWFIHTYYRLSPPIAKIISENRLLQLGTRIFLTPVQLGAQLIMLAKKCPLAAGTIAFTITLLLMAFCLKKRSRNEL